MELDLNDKFLIFQICSDIELYLFVVKIYKYHIYICRN